MKIRNPRVTLRYALTSPVTMVEYPGESPPNCRVVLPRVCLCALSSKQEPPTDTWKTVLVPPAVIELQKHIKLAEP